MILVKLRDVALRIQRGQLRRAELLDGQHPAELADEFIVQRVGDQRAQLVHQHICGEQGEGLLILLRRTRVHGNAVGKGGVALRRLREDGVKDVLLAPVMLIQRRRPYADGLRDLLDTDRVIAAPGEQAQGFEQDFFPGVDKTAPMANED